MSHLGAPLACVLRLLNVADDEEDEEVEDEEEEELKNEEEDWRDELVACSTELSLFLQNNDKLGPPGHTLSFLLQSAVASWNILNLIL